MKRVDIVCGMEVDADAASHARLIVEHAELRYVFCSESCRNAFLMNPARFLAAPPSSASPGDAARDAAERLRACGVIQWLEQAVARGASDLFVSVGRAPILKVFGAFRPLDADPVAADHANRIAEAVVPDAKRDGLLRGAEVDVGLDVSGLCRFRVNVFREQHGIALAFRPIPKLVPRLATLGLPPMIEELTHCTRGLVLVTGPTGSGKSTTLASMIDAINRREQKHIITIEDPIEYVIESRRSLIHQRELDAHTRSFSDALRASMREHPDIIMVGELRDRDSMALALRAAETGHLVLATMHCGSVTHALTRFLDVFEADIQPQVRTQLSQSLRAVVSQRLFRRVDEPGMVAAAEILVVTTAIRNLLRRNAIHEIQSYLDTSQRAQSLDADVRRLMKLGKVSRDALDEVSSGLVGVAARPS